LRAAAKASVSMSASITFMPYLGKGPTEPDPARSTTHECCSCRQTLA
jgi:hypothetical protein